MKSFYSLYFKNKRKKNWILLGPKVIELIKARRTYENIFFLLRLLAFFLSSYKRLLKVQNKKYSQILGHNESKSDLLAIIPVLPISDRNRFDLYRIKCNRREYKMCPRVARKTDASS